MRTTTRRVSGMVNGMASVKITITVPEEQLQAIRELVDAGQARSVSGFVQHAIGVSLDDASGWQEMLDDALDATGGPLTDEERRWADEALSQVHGPRP